MAIWQLHFQLISADDKSYDTNRLLSDASISILTEEFPVAASWCKEDRLFGNLDATCVEVRFYNSVIDEISVRLDIQNISKKQLDAVIQFAQFNNLQILYNEKTISATTDNVCTMIRESDALRFLENPERFLTELSGNNK